MRLAPSAEPALPAPAPAAADEPRRAPPPAPRGRRRGDGSPLLLAPGAQPELISDLFCATDEHEDGTLQALAEEEGVVLVFRGESGRRQATALPYREARRLFCWLALVLR